MLFIVFMKLYYNIRNLCIIVKLLICHLMIWN